jgi:hypothetical protein
VVEYSEHAYEEIPGGCGSLDALDVFFKEERPEAFAYGRRGGRCGLDVRSIHANGLDILKALMLISRFAC